MLYKSNNLNLYLKRKYYDSDIPYKNIPSQIVQSKNLSRCCEVQLDSSDAQNYKNQIRDFTKHLLNNLLLKQQKQQNNFQNIDLQTKTFEERVYWLRRLQFLDDDQEYHFYKIFESIQKKDPITLNEFRNSLERIRYLFESLSNQYDNINKNLLVSVNTLLEKKT